MPAQNARKSKKAAGARTSRAKALKIGLPAPAVRPPLLLPPGPPPRKKSGVELLVEALAAAPQIRSSSPASTGRNSATAERPASSAGASVPSVPSATPAAPPPTWGALEWVDPAGLSNHLRWRELLADDAPDHDEELRESIRRHGVTTPLIITGDGCASGRDVILSGHRRRQAAMDVRVRLVPVIRRTDLNADAEEELIIKTALGNEQSRRLLPSRVARLEARLFELYAGRHGGVRAVATNGLPRGGACPRGC